MICDMWLHKIPLDDFVRKYLKIKDDVTQSHNNIAYTNMRCLYVSNQIRKNLGKKDKYEVGETLRCRVYKKFGSKRYGLAGFAWFAQDCMLEGAVGWLGRDCRIAGCAREPTHGPGWRGLGGLRGLRGARAIPHVRTVGCLGWVCGVCRVYVGAAGVAALWNLRSLRGLRDRSLRGLRRGLHPKPLSRSRSISRGGAGGVGVGGGRAAGRGRRDTQLARFGMIPIAPAPIPALTRQKTINAKKNLFGRKPRVSGEPKPTRP